MWSLYVNDVVSYDASFRLTELLPRLSGGHQAWLGDRLLGSCYTGTDLVPENSGAAVRRSSGRALQFDDRQVASAIGAAHDQLE